MAEGILGSKIIHARVLVPSLTLAVITVIIASERVIVVSGRNPGVSEIWSTFLCENKRVP
jgi:hypothetical protein